jgi:hypothetical protein
MLVFCVGPALAQTDGEVEVSVSGGMTPVFSWTPETAVGRLTVVHEDGDMVWSSQTDGDNAYDSPIHYGVHSEDAAEDNPATPLIAGETYKVALLLWSGQESPKFELVGVQEFTVSGEAGADEDEVEIVGLRPALRVRELSPDFRFDGLPEATAYETDGDGESEVTDFIGNLITVEPEEGEEPDGRTVVRVLADKNDIVVTARCYDESPQSIVAFSKARDSELDSEDHLVIVLDTFMDGRSGYVFAVNPAGARFDGLVIEQGEDVNSAWDTIWEAKTSRDNNGWYAEVKIPIKSLSFKKGLSEWGFNIQRKVPRLEEISRWSGASQDYEIYQTSRAGLLTHLPRFDFGLGLSIRPALLGSAGDDGESVNYDGDFSLDMTQRLGPNLLSSLTVNTDFAETEVDVRQVNLSRFDLFFPEKRTFFTQGSDIFQFGVALDEDLMIPFFSRRIGLFGRSEDELFEIPINAGGKINGRVGNTNIGALVANTRLIDSLNVGDADEDINVHVPQTTMGAVRISQNILAESSVGMLATFGDQRGHSDAWMAGVDFAYRTSEFLNEKNFGISVWGLLNNGKDADGIDLEGNKSAFGVRVEYPNDLLDMSLMSVRIGDAFRPSLGFVPRHDIHLWSSTVEINPRPPWPWLRQMFMEVSGNLWNSSDNSQWESYEATVKPFGWLLESGDLFEGGLLIGGDRPPEAFEIASGVDVPSGEFSGPYNWSRFFLGATSAQKRKISTKINWEFGDYYNGDLSTLEGSVALRPSSFLAIEFVGERNTGTMMALPEDTDEEDTEALVRKSFSEELYGVRFLFNFSSDLQLSSFTQYDTESKEMGSNNRLRWTFDPLGDIFIVYNHNVIRSDGRWDFVNNQLPIKIQYTRRF